MYYAVISVGLKHEFSNNRDKATKNRAHQHPLNSHWQRTHGNAPKWAVSLFCMLSANSLTALTFGAIGFSGTDISFTACSKSVFGVKTARQEKKKHN